jgi:hypothetical protein
MKARDFSRAFFLSRLVAAYGFLSRRQWREAGRARQEAGELQVAGLKLKPPFPLDYGLSNAGGEIVVCGALLFPPEITRAHF